MHAYFKTDKFRHVLNDEELDKVVLGEDCAEWLRAELGRHVDVVMEEAIFEDWGWTTALTVNGSKLWLNVQDWSFEQERTWHLWIEPRGIVARVAGGRYAAARMRLRQLIAEVLSGDSAISEVQWSEAGPQ